MAVIEERKVNGYVIAPKANLQGANLREANLRGATLPRSIMHAKWGLPADAYTAFILLSLKVSLNPEITQTLLLVPGFCWSGSKRLCQKYPEVMEQLKTEWPELYEKLRGDNGNSES